MRESWLDILKATLLALVDRGVKASEVPAKGFACFTVASVSMGIIGLILGDPTAELLTPIFSVCLWSSFVSLGLLMELFAAILILMTAASVIHHRRAIGRGLWVATEHVAVEVAWAGLVGFGLYGLAWVTTFFDDWWIAIRSTPTVPTLAVFAGGGWIFATLASFVAIDFTWKHCLEFHASRKQILLSLIKAPAKVLVVLLLIPLIEKNGNKEEHREFYRKVRAGLQSWVNSLLDKAATTLHRLTKLAVRAGRWLIVEHLRQHRGWAESTGWARWWEWLHLATLGFLATLVWQKTVGHLWMVHVYTTTDYAVYLGVGVPAAAMFVMCLAAAERFDSVASPIVKAHAYTLMVWPGLKVLFPPTVVALLLASVWYTQEHPACIGEGEAGCADEILD